MFALTQRMGSRIKSGSLDGFFVWNKTILFQYITIPCLLFFRQADIQKKNAWRTDGYLKKFVYQICFYEYPPALGYATRKSPAVILSLFHCLQGEPSHAALFEHRPLKNLSTPEPVGDSAYSTSDAFIHHRAKHDFKKIERCQHGPIPGQNEHINGAGKQTLRLSIHPPLLHPVPLLMPTSSIHIHFSPKVREAIGKPSPCSSHVTMHPSLWYSSLHSLVVSPLFCEDFLRGHFGSTCWSVFLSVHFACPHSYISKNTQSYSDSMFIRWMFFSFFKHEKTESLQKNVHSKRTIKMDALISYGIPPTYREELQIFWVSARRPESIQYGLP